MNTEIQVKIKMENGVEVTLDVNEAKELHAKLGEIFDKKIEKEYIPYPTFPYYSPTIWYNDGTQPQPWKVYYTTSSDNASIKIRGVE